MNDGTNERASERMNEHTYTMQWIAELLLLSACLPAAAAAMKTLALHFFGTTLCVCIVVFYENFSVYPT